MNRYLLDTNHIGEAIGRVSVVRDRVQRQHRRGEVFATCGPVLCELFVGLASRKDEAKSRRRINTLLHVLRIWPVDMEIADHYADVYHALQKAGRALSQVDMILAEMARHFKAVLLTTDQDFQALPDVRTEDWLAKSARD